MTRIELTNFLQANFELDDVPTSIQDLVVSNVLDGYVLTDITPSDLIEACDNELFIQLWALRNK